MENGFEPGKIQPASFAPAETPSACRELLNLV
jgi:hypothetical protein